MERPYRFIEVDEQDGVVCIRLRQLILDDQELEALGAEIARLVDEHGSRKLVLSLGPDEPQCLYSVFLAKLVNLQKRLENDGGVLALAQVSPAAMSFFHAAGLEKFFRFFPNAAAARAALK